MNSAQLNKKYAAFGEVIKGMNIVHKIEKVKTDSNDKPLEDVVIESVVVDTKGIEYEDPKILKN